MQTLRPIITTEIITPKNAKVLTLVPNKRRLDVHVAEVFRSNPEQSVIVAPPVVVFSQWVEDLLVRICLLEGNAAPRSIHTLELQQLWANALSRETAFLADGEQHLAARQARAAQRMIHHWWVNGASPRLDQRFWATAKTVAEQLEAEQILTPEGWLQAFGERLADPAPLPLQLPEKLLLDGFIEITALEQWVLDRLSERNVAVDSLAMKAPQNTQPGLKSFPSLEDELSAAAFWAREQSESGASNIAVVVNQLPNHLHEVRTVFENVFCIEQRSQLQDLDDCDFHLVHGEPISEHPIIQDALLLLSLSAGGLKHEAEFPSISRWLLSPHWRGADIERSSRAALELRLRRLGRFWQSPFAVLRLAKTAGQAGELDDLLGALDEVGALATAGLPAGGIAQHFYNLLKAWGWPGQLASGAEAQKLVGHFGKLLEQLARLEPQSNAEALYQLRQLCLENQPVLRGGPLSPVQIMNMEDAVNRRFDAAWVANVHDGNWPGQPLQNPFLPPAARDRIPRSTSEGELAYCRLVTEQLKSLAPRVRFSYSRQSGDIPNSMSPLLDGLEATPESEVPSTALYRLLWPELDRLQGYRGHHWLRARQDAQGLPLSQGKAQGGPQHLDHRTEEGPEPIPGGSAMFRDQSDCPLLAYLRYRLNARIEDAPTPFADAAYRGSLMHTAMQYLFSGQLGQPGMPPESAVEPAVDAALQYRHAAERLMAASLDAERARLVRLLIQWLDFEGSRNGFRVHAVEEEINTSMRGHPLRLRADRIDRLDSGELLIIDYKSSAQKTSGWAYDRLRQAQLPLYAVLLSQAAELPVGGATLATVRGGECAFDGITSDPANTFEGIKDLSNRRTLIGRTFDSWDDLVRHWQLRIDELALEIENGHCANTLYDPDNPSVAALELLLRRNEAEAWLLENGELHKDAEA